MQCTLPDQRYSTVYVHTDSARSPNTPVYDSYAHPAIEATEVILDGSISATAGIRDVDGTTYLTFNGMFTYFYHFDEDDTKWNAAASSHWNAVLEDGTLMGDCTLLQPRFPPYPPSAPRSPARPNETHSPPAPAHPPAPPLGPPPPSPPFAPLSPQGPPPLGPSPPTAPPSVVNVTDGIGIALNGTDPDWRFEVIILEDHLTNIYFTSGYTVEEGDYVVFVAKSVTDVAAPGDECATAYSLSTTHSAESNFDLLNADHGGYVQVESGTGRLYVDVVLHNQNPASADPVGDPVPILEKSAAYFL